MQRTRSSYKATKNSTYTTNGTGAIAGINDRNMHEDVADSFFNLTDDKFQGAGGLLSGAYSISTLKSIATASLAAGPPGVLITIRDTGASNLLRVYELCTGTDAEALPSVVRPSDYDGSLNQKVWKIATVSAGSSTPSIVNDIRSVPTAGGAMSIGQYQVVRQIPNAPLSKAYIVYELMASASAAEQWPYLVAPNDYNPSTNAVMWRTYSVANSLIDTYYSAGHGLNVGDILDNSNNKITSSSTVPASIVVFVPDANNYSVARGGIFYLQTASAVSYPLGINYAQPNATMSAVPSNYPFANVLEIINPGTGKYYYSCYVLTNSINIPIGNKIFMNENFI